MTKPWSAASRQTRLIFFSTYIFEICSRIDFIEWIYCRESILVCIILLEKLAIEIVWPIINEPPICDRLRPLSDFVRHISS
eukprot:COSAG01_NODE_54892_length_329_cov_0.643478_2_plen_80_part_01